MLLLSRVLGQVVAAPDGPVIGQLADLTARLDGGATANLVDRLLLRHPNGGLALLPWAAVAGFRNGRVLLAGEIAEPAGFPADGLSAKLAPDEILLKRDVLDTQVVDVVGQRLARVADVVLGRTQGGRLELLGVEVGFGGVLRRLGLRRRAPGEDIVSWADLHLTSERGHAVQLSTPRAAVHRLDARGLAALVSRVDTDAATEILAAEEPARAASAVQAAHPEVGERVLRAMASALADRIVASMPAEHRGRWRARLARRPAFDGRRFLRSRVWPHRRHLVRGPRR